MIIACSACGARFRIADEKVGSQGARVRCSRCGHVFAVRPPEPAPPPPAIDVAAPETDREPTGTGGWPTGALDLDGTPSADPPSSAGQSLSADPFAAFAGISAGPPATPASPQQPATAAPAAPAPEPTPVFTVGEPGQDLGGLPVTDLSALERTGAASIPAPLPPEPTPGTGADLALEDRTPQGGSLRGADAAWSRPEATQAVAVGPDGFQEVDLREASPSEPGFDALETGTTQEAALPPPPPTAPTPPPGPSAGVSASSPAAPAEPPAPSSTASAVAQPAAPGIDATEGRRLQPARVRAAAMNVLSLAALLLVTVGIVAWWRGDSPAAVLRWPWTRPAGAVEVTRVSSGIYEGPRGMPVLFVRGVVRAGDVSVAGPVAVRVALSRGGRPVATAVAPVGAVPSAEDVALVSSPDDLGKLAASVAARAPSRLEAGAELPFLVLLPAPDGDVGTLRFRVETEAPGVR